MTMATDNQCPQPVGTELTVDEVCQLLSSRRRRYILYYLYLYDNTVRLPYLADQVTQWERSEPSATASLDTYNSLYHNHIPRFAEAGVVNYSQEEDVIELAENLSQFRPYLEQAAETDLRDIDALEL